MKLLKFALTTIRIAFTGGPKYYAWLLSLILVMVFGALTYLQQLKLGLIVTDMRAQVSWGSYIANFTFFVGVAAAAVMIVAPAYLYNKKDFREITIFGELLAFSAVVMSLAFVLIDLGRIDRMLHILPFTGTPNWPQSLLTWDIIVLNGYLFLNMLIPGYMLYKKFYHEHLNRWIYFFVFLSIPWAVSIHTVTAFLYGGLIARPFWNVALMAPRFLAGAFASGPALVILVIMALRRYTCLGKKGCKIVVHDSILFKLAQIILVSLLVNLFFIGSEVYTALYGAKPADASTLRYLFFGLMHNGILYAKLTPYFWTSIIFMVIGAFLLMIPKTRYNLTTLAISCFLIFVGVWIEKGMDLVIAGMIPTPLGEIWQYYPTMPEIMITLMVWALGFFVYTLVLKVALAIEGEEIMAK
ncbi:MAG TPA: polysulfide reductase [Euryarchaeota archaeon]|nr:putative hydrogenase 2 b cytochrome subunit [archaeon BMS3Bbin15]HDL15414.1 polysulfide reductase [Euryarchaeota archaeon]